MTQLMDEALEAAAEAVNDSGLLTYHWTKAYDVAKIAITAYLTALQESPENTPPHRSPDTALEGEDDRGNRK